jgi:4-carboxymuconolactone decarboxylase
VLIIHLAFYAGWPRAMSAITLARELFGQDGDEQ